jgi:thiol-disulfide isomerase/thioredoxin
VATTRRPLTPVRIAFARALTAAGAARAQEAPRQAGAFRTVEDLNAAYDRQRADLERRRLADLAALASRASGPEADAAYRALFLGAIARDLAGAAGPAAEHCLAATDPAPDVRALATLVAAVADTERGSFEKALGRFGDLARHRKRAGHRGRGADPDPEPLLAAGEAFLRYLIRATRYEPARRLCSLLVAESGEPEVTDHFASRLRVLKLVGRPAPPIEGPDVDGRPVRLAGLRGKVVLVTFWASWCPPCLAEFPRLNALAEAYGGRGFEVLGVDVDAHHQDVKDVKAALPVARHVLVHHGVTWPNLLDDGGGPGIARSYGIETVPANVLIGRDGTVLGVEIGEAELAGAVARALGDRPR